ncbi:MAG: BspA family leucine-rich repeat surface protein, partial [Pseudomonadales bacterium]|nr:BspA family leucine-rich repeat surface protein [Pseudomonadales bacterium]
IIVLNGEAELSVSQNLTYTDLGVSAFDDVDGVIEVTVSGYVNSDVVGTYILTYQVTDSSGNTSEVTRTITVFDETAPFITLIGANEIQLEVDSMYQEQNALVNDNNDLILSVSITGEVNSAVVGSYELIYNVSDAAGNVAIAQSRTVNVVDTSKPILTLIGDSIITLEVFDVYFELGVIVLDNDPANLTINITGEVNSAVVGSYHLTYNVSDSAGNVAIAQSRTVFVVDTTAPVMSLIGESEITLEVLNVYVEAGVSVVDNVDSNLNAKVIGVVDYSVIGIYPLTYHVSDSAGNTAQMLTRTVTVVDTTKPVLTLNGANEIELIIGDSYIELGVTITDNLDEDLSAEISGSVDTTKLGSYAITYQVRDAANNQSSIIRLINVVPFQAFVTTWKTDAVQLSKKITLQVNEDFFYNYNVDWGDGQTDQAVHTEISHTYAEVGTYTVSIDGVYPQLYFRHSSDAKKLLSVEQWGSQRWVSMHQAFLGCSNLVVNATDQPNLLQVKDMSSMFENATNFNQDINHWDVSFVEDMSSMFKGASNYNQTLNNWDVSSVRDMSDMFAQASNFDQSLNNWNVSLVQDMSDMFHNASKFNQALNNWDVSAVTDMTYMFGSAIVFDQEINTWDVSSVNSMFLMFNGANEFNQALNNWDVKNVTTMFGMFQFAGKFNQDINSWDVSSVTDMQYLFMLASSFNQELNDWDLSSATAMDRMFMLASNFNQPLNNWDLSSVTGMDSMLRDAKSFDQDLSAWNINNVEHMNFILSGTDLSTENYDLLLLSWSNQMPKDNVTFGASNTQYTPDSLTQSARTALIDTFGWTIVDAGPVPAE